VTISQKIVLAILRPLVKVFLSWKVEGRGNIPSNGPFIVIANHVHALDPILLMLGFPQWINFMAKEELFRSPGLRHIMRWAQVFPVSRRGTLKDKQETLRKAKDILDNGLILGMFPEGKRSRDGRLNIGKSGSAAIAAKANAPVLPVGVVGTDKIKGISWLWKRPSILINIGESFKLPPVDGKLNRSQMKSLTDLMMTKIAALLPPEYQGAYSSCLNSNDDN
jgi:1-acyl-sn-glycerol-3-phosphate acyltransferase